MHRYAVSAAPCIWDANTSQVQLVPLDRPHWRNLANWSIRLFDMSRSSERDFPEKSGRFSCPNVSAKAYATYPVAACNFIAITAVRSSVSLSHTLARNRSNRREFPRNLSRFTFTTWTISGQLIPSSPPSPVLLFFAIAMSGIMDRRDVVDWNSDIVVMKLMITRLYIFTLWFFRKCAIYIYTLHDSTSQIRPLVRTLRTVIRKL